MNHISRQDQWLLTAVRLCLVLVCLMPLVVSYSTVFPFVVGKALYARALVEIAFAGWLILAWRVPQYRPPPSIVLLALLGWLAVSILTSFTGVNVTRSLWSDYARMQGMVELAHWCGFILVVAAVFRSVAVWRLLLTVNLAVSALVSALGLGHFFGLVDWVFLFSETSRAGSTLGSGLFLGAYAMLSASLGVALLLLPWSDVQLRLWRSRFRWRGAWTRYLLVGAVFLNLAGLWFSASRSGLLGAVVMALVFAGGMLLLDRRPVVLRLE